MAQAHSSRLLLLLESEGCVELFEKVIFSSHMKLLTPYSSQSKVKSQMRIGAFLNSGAPVTDLYSPLLRRTAPKLQLCAGPGAGSSPAASGQGRLCGQPWLAVQLSLRHKQRHTERPYDRYFKQRYAAASFS